MLYSINRHQYARERDQKIIEKMKRENMAVNDIRILLKIKDKA